MTRHEEILGLSIGYAVLAVLLLILVARARLPWWLKAGAIVVTSAFYVLVFYRTQGLLGWSATQGLPDRFQLLWVRTVEPDPSRDDPGSVHLWVEALDERNLPNGDPRAFQLPYTWRLAQRVEAARVEIQAGRPQGGRAVDFGVGEGSMRPDGPTGPAGRSAEPGGDPAAGGAIDPTFLGGDTKSVQFAPLPAPKLPAKDP